MQTVDSRILVVVRHARAADHEGSDHDRPLTAAGHSAAHEAGLWLRTRGVEASYALVSSARRTVQTWQGLAQGAGWALEPSVAPTLYSAGVDAAIDLVNEIDDEVDVAVLVGHNPTVAMLAALLPDGTGDPSAEQAVAIGGFPPGSIAVFRIQGDWWDVREGAATLIAHRLGDDE